MEVVSNAAKNQVCKHRNKSLALKIITVNTLNMILRHDRYNQGGKTERTPDSLERLGRC